jgi:hypothetical protein
MGRVGRPAAAQPRRLRCLTLAVFRLVRGRPRRVLRGRSARPLPAGSPPRPAPSSGTHGSMDRARRHRGAVLDLVGHPSPFIWNWSRLPPRAPGRAGTVPPADAADVEAGPAVRTAGLGGERGGKGVQPAGGAPRAQGRQGRAPAADSALPLQGDAGRGAGSGGPIRGAGVRRHARSTRPTGHPGAAAEGLPTTSPR